jgi:hypothetical protein
LPFAAFDYSRYRNAPDGIASAQREPRPLRTINTIRELEAALRDAGFNRHEAKRIASGGWQAFARKPDRLPGSRELASHIRALTNQLRSL